MMNMLHPALFVLAISLALPAFAADTSGTSSMEILRQKITADKKFLVVSNMKLTDAEAKEFWPIYKAYQKDLHQINERLAKVIKDYAAEYNKGALSDDTAKKLLNEAKKQGYSAVYSAKMFQHESKSDIFAYGTVVKD